MADGIFAGLQVIDCASWIAGPAAATILSDFGAKVIKIEPPEPVIRAGIAAVPQNHGLLVAADGPQQAEPGHRSQAPEDLAFCTACSARPTSSSPTSLAGARAPEDRAADLLAINPRLVYGSITAYARPARSGPDRLRRDRLLGPHRPDGHVGHHRDEPSRSMPAWRPSHRDAL